MPVYKTIASFSFYVENDISAKSENEALKILVDRVVKNRKISKKDFMRLDSSALFIGE